MKDIVYGFVASALLLTSLNAHDIWVEKNDKNQAQIFFGEFADNEKEGAKFLDRIKAETFYPQGIVKDVKWESTVHFCWTHRNKYYIISF